LGGLAHNTDIGCNVSPQALNVKGGTQPEVFKGTVDAMVQELKTDPVKFWQDALATDGPIEIWEINGERWLFNGNHRYQAAIQAGADIPAANIKIVDKTGSTIPTWRFDQMTWLPGLK
jgi:hypothetical protein